MSTTKRQRVGIVLSVLWLFLWVVAIPSAVIIRTAAEGARAADAANAATRAADDAYCAALDKAANANAISAADDAYAAAKQAAEHAAAARVRTARVLVYHHCWASLCMGVIPLLIGWGVWWIRKP